MLLAYKNIFLKHALSEPHVLIQKFSGDIAKRIELAFPKTYSSTEISSLEKVGKSALEPKDNGRGNYIDSYLHQNGSINPSLKFHSAYDFDRYWYEPLGNVFGISKKQIEELCTDVVFNEWNIRTKTGYNNDPRISLWNMDRNRETWHSHSSYPKTDNWYFYLSYHSMLIVAAKLIENMPIITKIDSCHEEEPWGYWLSHHILTRMDGKWLADCRGALPLERPKWTSIEEKYEDWRINFQDQDFLNCLIMQDAEEVWFNIKGNWTEKHNSRYETYSISTALVSKETSEALLRALETSSNCQDYKLPDYLEESVEIDSGIFKLKGFIYREDSAKGLDEFDLYAANLIYPQYSFGDPFLKDLALRVEDDGKIWRSSNGQVSLKCDTWGGNVKGYDEDPEQNGMRLSASVTLLKKICKLYDCDLIIDVNLSRDIEYKRRSENYKYLNPTHKIFILSTDGRLKCTRQNIKFW